MNDVTLLCEDPGRSQVFLGRLNGGVAMFGMHFALPKKEMLLQE